MPLDIWDAAATGDLNYLRQLLSEYPGDVNLTDSQYRTPLMRAASNNHSEVVAFLLSKGADASIADRESGWTALHHALDRGCLVAASLLLAISNELIYRTDNVGMTAADLISFKARVRSRAWRDQEPLSWAKPAHSYPRERMDSSTNTAELDSNNHTDDDTTMQPNDCPDTNIEDAVIHSDTQSSTLALGETRQEFTLLDAIQGLDSDSDSPADNTIYIERDHNLYQENFMGLDQIAERRSSQKQAEKLNDPGPSGLHEQHQGDNSLWETTEALFTLGESSHFQLGYPPTTSSLLQLRPRRLDTLAEHKIIDICASTEFNTVVTSRGRVFVWGHQADGRLGLGDRGTAVLPQVLGALKNRTVRQVSHDCSNVCALTDRGEVYLWGRMRYWTNDPESTPHSIPQTLESLKETENANKKGAKSRSWMENKQRRGGIPRGRLVESTVLPSPAPLHFPVKYPDIVQVCAASNTVYLLSSAGEVIKHL